MRPGHMSTEVERAHNMATTSDTRRRAPHWLPLLALALCLIFLICGAAVRFYPYPMAFTAFPRTTQTRSGVAGDPINVIFVGSQEQITGAFEHAGWLIPDPITVQTTAKIVAASIAHQAYPTAPVSNLYVFGRAQDLALEKPTNDVQYRDHIRLWRTDESFAGQPVWIAQASYDAGIELGATNELPTHHISPTVDLERNAVGAALRGTGLISQEITVAYTAPVVFARNGGGDYYESDGDVLMITFTHASIPLPPQPLVVAGLKTGVFLAYDAVVSLGAPLLAALVILAILAGCAVALLAHRATRRRRAAISSLPEKG